jgi:hypothetical protein
MTLAARHKKNPAFRRDFPALARSPPELAILLRGLSRAVWILLLLAGLRAAALLLLTGLLARGLVLLAGLVLVGHLGISLVERSGG